MQNTCLFMICRNKSAICSHRSTKSRAPLAFDASDHSTCSASADGTLLLTQHMERHVKGCNAGALSKLGADVSRCSVRGHFRLNGIVDVVVTSKCRQGKLYF